MPKYKKCPRCDLNYILEEEEYCKICQEELRGISHNTEDLDEEIEEDGILCPRCHVNYLNDGETICEACAAEEESARRSAWTRSSASTIMMPKNTTARSSSVRTNLR